MRIKAFIAGCTGHRLTVDEARFFRANGPWGFILFARNVDTPDQVRALVAEMRACTGRDDTPILIDQEGGRVQRLRPPHWTHFPPAEHIGRIYEEDSEKGRRAAWLHGRLIAGELADLGINVDCLPLLDVPAGPAHNVIGDRAYSRHPHIVAELGRQAANGLKAGGVIPVMKHMPGHGRAGADSHLELPVVDSPPGLLGCTDLYPFMQMADLPIGMTAHVVYSGFDETAPATHSAIVIQRIIRGWIGFDGLLLTDDISMNALSGDYAQRTSAAFAAGCDVVLHCNGEMEEMAAVADASPELVGVSARRAEAALSYTGKPDENPADQQALREEFDALAGVAA